MPLFVRDNSCFAKVRIILNFNENMQCRSKRTFFILYSSKDRKKHTHPNSKSFQGQMTDRGISLCLLASSARLGMGFLGHPVRCAGMSRIRDDGKSLLPGCSAICFVFRFGLRIASLAISVIWDWIRSCALLPVVDLIKSPK